MIIAIVGLGQIGSSIGAGLIKRRFPAHILGIVRRTSERRDALKLRTAHDVTLDTHVVSTADVIVLATPLSTILEQLPSIIRQVAPGTLITDVGSTKRSIMRTVAPLLKARNQRKAPRDRISFIGGHPMAGSERRGLAACDPELFLDRPWFLLLPPGTPRRYTILAQRIVRALEARPVWMKDPDEHDRIVAHVSHLPHVLAYTLMHTLEPQMLHLAGPSFRDATRVAASDPTMVMDLLLSNRHQIETTIRTFEMHLHHLLRALKKGDGRSLLRFLETARRRRYKISVFPRDPRGSHSP